MVLDSSWSNDDNYVASGEWMRLSEYIFNEYEAGHSALSIETMDVWIVEWYKKEFGKAPPEWLANWRKK